MDINVFAKDGKLAEIHYIVERKLYGRLELKNAPRVESEEQEEPHEYYILLDQVEPRIFCLGETKIEETTLDTSLFNLIMEEAEHKFKDIRLQAVLNPQEQENPPILTFFEDCITKKGIETIKEDLKKEFLNKKTDAGEMYDFVCDEYEFEQHVRFITLEEKDYFEFHFYIPVYDTFSTQGIRFSLPHATDFVGKIRFKFEEVDKSGIEGEIVITKIV
ncbi:hypothetical protein LKM00_26505 [Bacillus wiedmannii]|uniref:hypothetical protein n=1 Tax=Bacillus wiedmannii TaxID=1890302 RepID=UPI001E5E2FC5|nr:hypothetical protein [Bacillus wiedmannii]MCC2380952.1 hypothetical protein [Bacillus wiedmannii]MCC2425366.1 hypothetical protein [Bacillus wiedmannii]